MHALSVTELAVYSMSTPILQVISIPSGSHGHNIILTTPEFILDVNIETVVRREQQRKESMEAPPPQEEGDVDTHVRNPML